MAGTYTVASTTIMGNKKVRFYTVTNYTNTETLTAEGFTSIDMVIPCTSTADKTVGWSVSGATITFATGADTYDGVMMIIGH